LAGSVSPLHPWSPRAAVRVFALAAVGLVAVAAVAPAAGCSLLTSFDGLTGGPDGPDGDVDALVAEGGSIDAAVDAPTGNDATTAGTDAETGTDAATKVGALYVFGGETDTASSAAVYVADIHPDGTLGAWQPMPALPENRTYAEAVLGSGFVALVGGSGPSGAVASTFLAMTKGTVIGDWSSLGSFAIPRTRHGATIANDRLYVIGGTDASDAALVDVQVATISSTTIGTFASTSPLPVPRSRIAVASTSKFVYVFGGSDAAGNAVSNVYRAPINVDGTLGTFEGQIALPSARTHAQADIVVPGHVLVTGGEGVTDTAIVYDIDSTLGTLGAPHTTLALPPTDHHASATFGNHVYVIGGFGNTAARLTDVLVGDVAADGTVTQWTPTTSLPVALAYHSAAAL
jgi:N-acetylneuraminic acid mutarotase